MPARAFFRHREIKSTTSTPVDGFAWLPVSGPVVVLRGSFAPELRGKPVRR